MIAADKQIIALLVAGIVERRKVLGAGGQEVEVNVVQGIPDGYLLAYRNGHLNAPLPYWPDFLLIFIDKQKTCVKYLVFAVRIDLNLPGQCEAHLVDMGREDDETQLKENVIKRPYRVKGFTETARISAGFMDSRYRPQAVFQFCLDCYHELGISIWPVRGEGEKEKKSQGDKTERQTESNVRGKILRYVKDWCEKGELMVRYFKDHPLKTIFYSDKLHHRLGWRIWLPKDYPQELASEWTAEVYDEDSDTWIHNAQKRGPNDYGDTGKMLVLWLMEHLPVIISAKTNESEQSAIDHSRAYFTKWVEPA